MRRQEREHLWRLPLTKDGCSDGDEILDDSMWRISADDTDARSARLPSGVASYSSDARNILAISTFNNIFAGPEMQDASHMAGHLLAVRCLADDAGINTFEEKEKQSQPWA